MNRHVSTWSPRRYHLLILVLWGLSATLLPAADPPALRPDRQDPRSKLATAIRQHLNEPLGSRLFTRSMTGTASGSILMRLDAEPDAATLAAITATGVPVLRTSQRWHEVQVAATPDQALALARIAGIQAIRPAWRPFHRATAPVTDQADAVIHTDALRTAYGVDGSGVTIGVISDSINLSAGVGTGTVTGIPPNAILTATIPQLSGDMPPRITLVDPGTAASGNSDEGAAMMEELFHLAPGATYAFATSGTAETSAADNIAALKTAGCRIICDDIGFYAEPMFQDGPIAQAIDTFVAAGGIYLSAAGNDADQGILAPYSDINPSVTDPHTGTLPAGSDFHNWGIGGTTPGMLPITITPHGGMTPVLTIVLEWNQPFKSNNLGAGSQSDYDFYLFSAPAISMGNLLEYGADYQGGPGNPGGDPVEIIQHPFSASAATTVYLAIDRYVGDPALLRLVFNISGGSLSFPSPPAGYPAATIYGHPAAAGALAIAASRYSTPSTVEYFSSRGGWASGGLPFYFSITGAPLTLAPLLRNKPDLTAPDGVACSLADFNPFYGTSGAVPHATATAALLWSICPARTNQGITSLMTTAAVDLTNAPASSGDDAWSGHGLVDAIAAASAAVPATVTTLAAAPASTALHTGTATLQVTFARAVTVTGRPTLALNTTPPRRALYTTGSGGTTLTFTYSLVPGDSTGGRALDALTTAALATTDGTLTDSDGNRVRLTVPVGASSGSLAGSQLVIDASGPALAITATPSTSNQPTFTCSFAFSAPVSGFTAGSVTVDNGSLTNLQGSGSSYSATITATTPGTVTITVPVGAVQGAGGVPAFGATASVTYDTVPPSLALGAPASVIAGDTAVVTFTFSKPVLGFTANSVILSGGQAGTFGGSGAAYVLDVVAGPSGNVGISVHAGAATDQAGNALAGSAQVTIPIVAAPAGGNTAGGGGSGGGSCGLGGLASILMLIAVLVLRRSVR